MPIASLGTPVAEVNAAKGDGRPRENGPGLPSKEHKARRHMSKDLGIPNKQQMDQLYKNRPECLIEYPGKLATSITPEVEQALRDFNHVMDDLDRRNIGLGVEKEGLAMQILAYAYQARDVRQAAESYPVPEGESNA